MRPDRFRATEPQLSFDGRVVWFASDRPPGGPSTEIFSARVLPSPARFEPPVHVALLSGPNADFDPAVDAAGNVFFSSDRPGGSGAGDIWMAPIACRQRRI